MSWVELIECEETYTDLADLILTEQFMIACDKRLVLFLKEHELKIFGQEVKMADLYINAHGDQDKSVT